MDRCHPKLGTKPLTAPQLEQEVVRTFLPSTLDPAYSDSSLTHPKDHHINHLRYVKDGELSLEGGARGRLRGTKPLAGSSQLERGAARSFVLGTHPTCSRSKHFKPILSHNFINDLRPNDMSIQPWSRRRC